MFDTKTVAVTGLTGYVGQFVAAELVQRGFRVRALVRRKSDRGGFSENAAPISWVEGDLTDNRSLAALVEGVAAIVHLAYAHIPGRYRGGEGDDLQGWLTANADGSMQLLKLAQKAHVPRFVFLSSRAVFSRTEAGRVLDEDHPTSPDTEYGSYKVAVETALQQVASEAGMYTHSVRATGIYGITRPIERSKWWPLIQAVVRGEPIEATGGGTEVHGEDVARVIVRLLSRADGAPPIVHLSDLFVTQREVVRLARTYAGRPGPLPGEPQSEPANVLVSRTLDDLAIRLGGHAALERTIAQMVDAALQLDH